MKLLSAICIAIVVAVALGEEVKNKLENVDVDAILSNERLLKGYMNCLLDKGPCTAEAKSLKERLPEALAMHCNDCTPNQKSLGKKVALNIMEKHPDYWKQLTAKFDPEGKYRESFQQYLRS